LTAQAKAATTSMLSWTIPNHLMTNGQHAAVKTFHHTTVQR